MEELTLTADPNRVTGSRASNRLRASGHVPAVVYGRGIDPLPVSVPRRALRAALTTEAGTNALINLRVGGDSHLTLVRDLQRDPIRNEVVHVDFVLVDRDKPVTVEVPIVLTGDAEQVTREQGVVEQALHALTVQARPTDIPNEITADVSELTIGDSIRVGDLKLPPGVTTEVDPEDPVAVAQVSRAAIEAEQLEEAEAEAAALEELAEAGVEPGEELPDADAGDAEEQAAE